MTEAPPSPAPVTSGDLDAAAVRRVWDAVLDAVAQRKRTTRALLDTAQVTALNGRELTLTFQHSPLARQFDKPPNHDVIHDALAEVLGVDWVVRVDFGDGTAPPAAQAPRETPAAPPPPPEEEFDPRDAADDEPAPTARPGEDPAMALLKSGLGAQVISSVED